MQEYGIDYEETFAHVARLTSVRAELLLQLPLLTISHVSDGRKKMLSLIGSSLRKYTWNVCLVILIVNICAYDSALFRRQPNSGLILVLLYVDDMIITSDDLSGIHTLKISLSQQLEMNDLGDLRYFLSLEVTSNHTGYFLSQIKYASNLVFKSGVSLSDNVMSSMEENWKHSTLTGELLSDPTYYRQLVVSLIYLTVTQPNIAYVVH
ncbi:hypothetical protein RJ639_005103 [Escallonia herrerae]|uniref:Reverse transcriptase Ty1/copia-type domain-containing protein n=1 Tax=Escallonia herrerae TaxID=1293975 RepID=A0AA89AY29_9ASTE|nr:hypothetical protein RJ639_005103 [Escallonia herrerae]